jgi:predicted metalloprotease with PDZ domain
MYRSLLSISLLAMTLAAQPSVHYTLGMSRPSSHFLEVEMRVSGLGAGDKNLDIAMPAWRTGRYSIFDFAGGVTGVSAQDGAGGALTFQKIDKQTWRINKGRSTTVIVRYRVYADEFNMRTRGLNDEHAFADPAAVFMYVPSLAKRPLTLEVKPYGSWKVTTGLDAMPGKPNHFTAPNYEYFADCPIEVGNQKEYTFDVDGVPHVWMIAGEGTYDIEKLIEDTKKIVRANKDFWGRLPYNRYIFMLHISPTSGGGTEHINSTIMGARPFQLASPGGYRGFLGLVSHEYFHTWNVKHLRPAGITPYDFSKENYSRELWVAEGTTSYYTGIILIRAGLAKGDEYIERLGSEIKDERQRPGNRKQSVAESSFDAWIKYWKNTPQAYNEESDYYDQGSNVSLALDLEILRSSSGNSGLHDVLRTMFERFPVGKQGYTLEDLQKVSEEKAGGSLSEFFAKFVTGTEPLPWEDLLESAGLDVKATAETRPAIGARLSDRDGRVIVQGVVESSAADLAGLSINDEIVAFNGYRARSQELNTRIGEVKPGEEMTLTVFRNEQLRTIVVRPAIPTIPNYTVKKVDQPSDLQKKIYEKWLGASWE